MTIPKEINICHRYQIPNSVVEQITQLNPAYVLNIFDDKKCIDFLSSNFGDEYAQCFLHIADGPIKADFWRVCTIYARGGFYFDVDVDHLLGVDDYLNKDASFITSTSWHHNMVNPIILGAAPKNEVLKRCIDRYVDMFRKRSPYSYWGWSICYIMHDVFKELGVNLNNHQKESELGNERYQFANEDKSSGNRDLLFTHYNGTKILMNHRKDYSESARSFV